MLFKMCRSFIQCGLILLPIVACADTYLPSIQKIMDKGKLVVSINAHDVPPMFSVNAQGDLQGYDIDLAHYLGENLGVPVEFVRTAQTFDEVVEVVSSGQADIAVSLLTPNLTRARKVFFTKPYVYLNKLLVYNRLTAAKYKLDDPGNQVQDIKDLKIGVLRGSSYIKYAEQQYPNAELVLFSTVADGLSAVKNNEIFGFFGNSANVPYALEQDKSVRLYVGISQLQAKFDPIAVAVSGKYPELLTWINLALELRKSEPLDNAFDEVFANMETK